MLSIQHLLNPEHGGKRTSTSTPSSRPGLMSQSTPSRQHKQQIKYPPYPILSNRNGLVPPAQAELARHHDQFRVSLRDGMQGRMEDKCRRIPYSSDKRDFLAKTGRDAFEVYEYEFRVPDNPDKVQVVMWDYENGLVRITPFFKACNYTKTTPKRALEANGALQQELSHSVTGGAVGAQGYWTPYACARALCTTFCYPIRWALTPIFGPSFVQECLSPDDPAFGKFKIDVQLVEDAQIEAEQWRKDAGYSRRQRGTGSIATQPIAAKKKPVKQLRLREKQAAAMSAKAAQAQVLTYGPDSPPVSPKTIPMHQSRSSGWTSVNNRPESASSTASSFIPHSGSVTPLILPAPVIAQPAATKAVKKYAKHSKRKTVHSDQRPPTSYPAPVEAVDKWDDSDDAYYRTIENYVIRSPTESPMSVTTPPTKKLKQMLTTPEALSQSASKHVLHSSPGTLDNDEMVAVSGLLKLFEHDEPSPHNHSERI